MRSPAAEENGCGCGITTRNKAIGNRQKGIREGKDQGIRYGISEKAKGLGSIWAQTLSKISEF